MTSTLTNPPERVIFNFHCPPYGSGLDDTPRVNPDMTPKHGGHAPEPVGSTAVRDAIEKTQPALSLHGHIHEARGHTRIGRTLCINPGSAYEQGELNGALVELNGKKVKTFPHQRVAARTTERSHHGKCRRPGRAQDVRAQGDGAGEGVVGVRRVHLRRVCDQPDGARVRLRLHDDHVPPVRGAESPRSSCLRCASSSNASSTPR
ncbi:MAG TPA: hypothetical protein VMU66_00575 [Gaiellales bacterium]|nr:hypothetical protein [Gaiellales bacterium]